MFEDTKAFSDSPWTTSPRAKQFYGETLALLVSEDHGMLTLHIAGDGTHSSTPKDDHTPATFTILNFPVDDIDSAVDQLVALRSSLRGLRRSRREGSDARGRISHRVVQGPSRQHPLVTPGNLGTSSPHPIGCSRTQDGEGVRRQRAQSQHSPLSLGSGC